jgi:homoserine O-acetyltransferase
MTDPFHSTDGQRTGSPLLHLQTVTFHEPLTLELGGVLPSVTCGYETYGTLNANRSNAVLVCHAISGDSHVARHTTSDDTGSDDTGQDDPGWWEALVGPGKAIDTNRYFVVCPNVLGGCRGSTGPGSIDPATGRPFGRDFPQVTVADMVDVQARLVDHLEIETLAAVVGGSLGGHQALVWATRYPDRVAACCAIATSPRLTAQALAFDVIGRNAIQSDPHFDNGQYYENQKQPDVGLAIARMLGHITYLSSEAMADKFDIDRHHTREFDTQFEKKFSVGSYLAYQGDKFTARFDANSYVTLSMAMDLVDFGAKHEQRIKSFAPATCRWLVVAFSSDWLFPPSQAREIVAALTAQDRQVTYAEITSNAGHDAFLIEADVAQYAEMVAATLNPPGACSGDDLPPRLDDQRILETIEPGNSVLDLGCGDGHLLAALRARGHGRLCGVEVRQSSIITTARRGLPVLDYDLNLGLPELADDSYDVVVLSATLQAVENLDKLFDEMLRVGKRCVLSFANFAYRDLRRMYYQQGRAPKMEGEYQYEWFNTPNRRFPSIADVEDFLAHKGATIHRSIYLDTHAGIVVAPESDPNLNADTAILVFSR